MKIDRKETGNGTATITVTVESTDINEKFKASLKDYSAKAQIKGFRKGKTPVNFIRKMHGHGILADTVNNLLQEALGKYIEEEKLDLIGQPIPSADDSENIDLDPFKIEDVVFNFDIAVSPSFDLKGADSLDTYTTYEVEVPDSMVNEEIENATKRLGSQESTDAAIEDNDMLSISAQELEGDAIKEGGHKNEFSMLVSMIKDEDAKAKFIGAKKGDIIDFDIYTLENGSSDDYVAKYLLGLNDSAEAENIGRMFKGEITDVKRVVPAEKNAAFFQQFTGDQSIETEEAAKEKIKTNIKGHYDHESLSLLKGKIASDIIEANPIDFPEAFMKRWIQHATENAQTLNIEEEYSAYAKQLQWTMIKSKLMEKHEIEVQPEDIQAEARKRVMSYFGGAGANIDEAMIEGIIPRLLNDQQQLQQIYGSVEFDKLMDELVKEVKTETKKLNTDEFKDVVEKYNEEMAAKNA